MSTPDTLTKQFPEIPCPVPPYDENVLKTIVCSTQQFIPKSQIPASVQHESDTIEQIADQCYDLLYEHELMDEDGEILPIEVDTSKCDSLMRELQHYSKLPQASKVASELSMRLKYIENYEATPIQPIYDVLNKISELQDDFSDQLAIITKGQQGEDAVKEILDIFEGEFISKYNVLLPSSTNAKQETSETDVCIIAPQGVFVCEVKNIGHEGQTLTISRDGKWLITNDYIIQNDFNNGRSTPAHQNNIHCAEIRRFLKTKGFHNTPVFPMVIIANNDIEIDNCSDYPVIRKEFIYNHITSANRTVLSKDIRRQIACAFDNVHIPERSFPILTVADPANSIIDYLEKLIAQYEQERLWLENLKARTLAETSAQLEAIRKEWEEQVKLAGSLTRQMRTTSLLLMTINILKLIIYPDAPSFRLSLVMVSFGFIIFMYISKNRIRPFYLRAFLPVTIILFCCGLIFSLSYDPSVLSPSEAANRAFGLPFIDLCVIGINFNAITGITTLFSFRKWKDYAIMQQE